MRFAEKLNRRLIHVAARIVPAPLCERLEEEWLAELYSDPSRVWRLRHAVGCCWASVVILRDAAPRPAASLPSAAARLPPARHEVRFGSQTLSYLTLQPATLFLIMGLQAALLCALALPLSPPSYG